MTSFGLKYHALPRVAGIDFPDRHAAPFTIDGRTLRAWMRGADLAAPKWKTAAIHWPELPPWRAPPPDWARYTVSAASVDRAKARAVASRPKPAGPNYERPRCEAADCGTTVAMLLDGLLDETGVATSRRVYNAEDTAMLARWERGLFSQIKYDAGPFAIRRPKKRGLMIEERAERHWRYLDRQVITALTDSDLGAAFSRMTYWSTLISAKIKHHCNAKTPACRAYQASAVVRDCYLYGLRVNTTEMISAAIVIEAVSEHLRRPGRIGWWQRTSTLDMLEGASSYEASERFGPDASSLRERFDSGTSAIEARFAKYCNELWEPPQKRILPRYNGNIRRISKPWLAEVQLTASERAALVLRYADMAGSNLLASDSPTMRLMASYAEIAWIRFAYKLVAGYLEAGGRILTGYWPNNKLPEKWFVDRRSAARVEEEGFTGSRYRKIGQDPFNGRLARRRFDNEFAQMRRVFRTALIDDIQDAQSGAAS
jgi:hypothetical protein